MHKSIRIKIEEKIILKAFKQTCLRCNSDRRFWSLSFNVGKRVWDIIFDFCRSILNDDDLVRAVLGFEWDFLEWTVSIRERKSWKKTNLIHIPGVEENTLDLERRDGNLDMELFPIVGTTLV